MKFTYCLRGLRQFKQEKQAEVHSTAKTEIEASHTLKQAENYFMVLKCDYKSNCDEGFFTKINFKLKTSKSKQIFSKN